MAQLEEDENGALSREFGVTCPSSLLELEHFNLCSGALIPDVMHDILEGTLPHTLHQLLSYCVANKHFFTLSHLNERILSMELGFMERNRPAPIDKCDHFKQNGMYTYIYNYVHNILI